MRISLIVAMAQGGVIGREGDLPWRISSDLRRFKKLTMGHHIIMGRITYESLGRPLPGRKMIVLTRREEYHAAECEIASDLMHALRLAAGDEEIFIIGGAEVYRQALPHVQRIYLTQVAAEVAGDTFFPEFDLSEWKLQSEEEHPAGERDEYPSTFRIYDRLGPAWPHEGEHEP